jgi:hypothetical protein
MIKKSPQAQFLFSVASSLKNETKVTSIVSLLCRKLVKNNETKALSIVFFFVASSLKNETTIWGLNPDP